jgi:hypothetical protein
LSRDSPTPQTADASSSPPSSNRATTFEKEYKQKLWQRYGFERTLRDDDATLVVARYILNNPVRARLVEDARDYAFVGSERHTMDEILESLGVTPSWSA